jgi:anti-anti-sigma factor
MKLVIVSQAQGGVPVTVLELQGRVNLGNAMELEHAALQAYNTGARDILIDLSKAPFLTSAGIRSILVIHKMFSDKSQENTRHLKLLGPTPHVRKVLEVAGLLDYIEVFTSLEEALSSF